MLKVLSAIECQALNGFKTMSAMMDLDVCKTPRRTR